MPGYYRNMAHERAFVLVVDEDGENLSSGFSTSARAAPGEWRRLFVSGAIPAAVGGRAVRRIRLIVIVDGFEPGEEAHIDDVALYRVD